MPISLSSVARSGSKTQIDLLEYCVHSAQPDPLFVVLVNHYQLLPSNNKAVVLFDVFCAANSPALLSTLKPSAPVTGRLEGQIKELRTPILVPKKPREGDEHAGETSFVEMPRLPAKFLFDELVRLITLGSESVKSVELYYDPTLTPVENLPGGKPTMAQRHFADNVWPAMRSVLVAGGFAQVASIG